MENQTKRYDLSRFTEFDLQQLKWQVDGALASFAKERRRQMKEKFKVGGRVYGTLTNQRYVFGTVKKVNLKTITIMFDDGYEEKVEPNKLHVIESVADGSVIPFRQRVGT